MLPTGPICYRCRRDLAYHPGRCPQCGQSRPLAYPSTDGDQVLVCAGCAGEASVFACVECGREDHPYGAKRCARCILGERLTHLLTDPATGQVHDRLIPVFTELMRTARPQSVITWLTKPPAIGPAILLQMARGDLPISHEAFRLLPTGRAENYLRDLLAATGVLPPYQPRLDQMERWLSTRLDSLPAEDAVVIGRYARWHLLRRLRGKAERDQLSRTAIYAARSNVNGAIRLSQWATAAGTSIPALTQPQLEAYFTEYPGGRNSQYGFITWLRNSKTNTSLQVPWNGTSLPEVVISDDQRWDSIDRLLHDDAIALYARIGGLFMLLYAQPLRTIVAMTCDQITLADHGPVNVTFDTARVQMPPVLDEMIRSYLHNRHAPSIAGTDHGWLFPGRYPGSHLVTEAFRAKLAAQRIHPGTARQAAMFSLAGQIPAPVLAELIGVADTTAGKWASLAARDWSCYIAQRNE